MKEKIRKWGLWCFTAIASLCLLVAGIVAVPTYETAAATAEHEFTVGAIAADAGDATAVYIIDANGDGTTWGAEENWSDVYTFEQGTGMGLSLNGVALTTTDIKQPGSLYIGLGVTAKTGDVLVIDGSYYSAATSKRITFNNSALTFNGTSWETWTGIYSGEMTLSTKAAGNNTKLYLATESTLYEESFFEWLLGGGVTINGQMVYINEAKTVDGEICITLNALNANDVVAISGVFLGTTTGTQYVAHECRFIWTGEGWSNYTTIDQTLSQINTTGVSANGNGFYITLQQSLLTEDWENAFTLVSGSGISLNGEVLSRAKIKPVQKTVYVDLGTTPSTGDLLSIQGTYYFEGVPALKIVFDCLQVLQYDGAAWVTYEQTYALGNTYLAAPSLGAGSAKNTQIYLTSDIDLPVNSWEDGNAFSFESGIGVKLNGVTTSFKMKSADGFLFIEIGAVSVGDVISVGGLFHSAANGGCKYLVNSGNYTWNGSTWEVGNTYTLLTVSNATAVGGDASSIYVAVGGDFIIHSWEDKDAFVLQSGKGISLNGEVVANAKMKPLKNQVYISLGSHTAEAGDIVAIEGTYESKADNASAKLIFEPVLLQFNGSAWGAVTAEHLGVMHLADPSKAEKSALNTQLYLESSVKDLPIQVWGDAGVFVLEQGAGLTINGVKASISSICSAPEGFFITFSGAKVNDVVTVSGVFKNKVQENVRYNIEESKFVWNGECWEEFGAYNTYTYEQLKTTDGSAANAIYLLPLEGGFPIVEGTWTEKLAFRKNSGAGVTINGEQISMGDIKIPGALYIGLGTSVNANDILVIDGIFYNDALNVKYIFDGIRFIWSGSQWISSKVYDDAELAAYNEVTIDDLGWGAVKTISGSSVDYTNLTYEMNAENTTGSIKFRFGYNTENSGAGEFTIGLRGGAWDGVRFKIAGNRIALPDDYNFWHNYISLSNDTEYEIELGAINLLDSSSVWVYIKVDGTIWFSDTQQIDAGFTTNNVSIYVGDLANTTVSDPDYVAINYVTVDGTTTEYAKKNTEYVLAANAATTFVGWEADSVLYQAGQTIALAETDLTLTAFVLDFTLDEGAAIRLASTADESGIRFTAYINEAELNKLLGYVAAVEYGMLIMPNDYLNGNMPNLTDFEAGRTVLQLPGEISETVSGYIIFRGAMKKLFTQNYGRDFAGRGYMIITLNSGETMTIYTPFNTTDNVRSVKTVALKFQADTTEYEKLSAAKKAVIDTYAASEIYPTNTATAVAAQMEEGYAAAYVINEKRTQTNFVGQRKENV